MSFSGTVSKTSHEGGILASFEGKPPSLGTNIRIRGGKNIGRVQSVIGNVKNPMIHIFPLSRGVSAKSAVGASIEIAPRDRTPKSKKNKGRNINRNGNKKNNDKHTSDTKIRPGDWICPKCKNHNYASKEICNRSSCDTRKPRQGVGSKTTKKRPRSRSPRANWSPKKSKKSNPRRHSNR